MIWYELSAGLMLMHVCQEKWKEEKNGSNHFSTALKLPRMVRSLRAISYEKRDRAVRIINLSETTCLNSHVTVCVLCSQSRGLCSGACVQPNEEDGTQPGE